VSGGPGGSAAAVTASVFVGASVDGFIARADGYIDGGITIQRFLREGLIQRLVITRVPVLIGQGIPLFGTLPADVRLRHVATRQYPSGLVQSEYQVEARPAAVT
jgi:dihydrofolate reductase